MHINHAQFIPFLVLCFIRVVSIQTYEASIQPRFLSCFCLGWDLLGKTLLQSTFYFKVEKIPQNTDWKYSSTVVHQRSASLEGKLIPHGATTALLFPVKLSSMQHPQASSDALTGSKLLLTIASFPPTEPGDVNHLQNSQAPVVVHMITSKFWEFPCHIKGWLPGRTEKLNPIKLCPGCFCRDIFHNVTDW